MATDKGESLTRWRARALHVRCSEDSHLGISGMRVLDSEGGIADRG